jgi:hypothetical protein
MTITVELPPELEEQFLTQASNRGLSLDAYVMECLTRLTLPNAPLHQSPAELDRILDEAADLVPATPPLSDFAMSRESIYTREDEW